MTRIGGIVLFTGFWLALAVVCLPALAQAQAPATDAAAAPVPDWLQYQNPYIGEQNNMANPNRTAEEIVTWSQEAAVIALTFTGKNFDAEAAELRKRFTPEAWAEYVGYLRQSGAVSMVREQKYDMNTILRADPVILNSTGASGVFTWTIDATPIITFTTPTPEGESAIVGSGVHRLTMQVSRAAENTGHDGLVISRWRVQ